MRTRSKRNYKIFEKNKIKNNVEIQIKWIGRKI